MSRGAFTHVVKIGLLMAFVVLALSACGGGGGGDKGGGGGGEQAEQKEQAQARTMPKPGKDLAAGEYVTEAFQPTVSFSVGKGWEVIIPDAPDTFSMGQEGGSLYISFWNVQKVLDPKNFGNALSAPDDMAAWLQEHPNVDAEEPEEVTIGGVSGVQFDTVASPIPKDNPTGCPEPCVPLFISEEALQPHFGIFESEKLRFIILENVEGETVTIAVGGRAVNFEEFLPKAQKVLDTVEWKGE